MFKKIISFLCALVMLSLCFVSCNSKTNKGGEITAESGEILTSDLASYTIVYGKSCSMSVAKKVNELATKLYSLYDVTVKTESDVKYEPSEKEILIGYTDRAESREFLNDIRSKDFGYAMVGGKLCIAGATDEFTTKAIDTFILTVLAQKSEKLELATPNIIRAEYDIDDLKINGESIKGWSVRYTSENKNSEKKIAELIRNKITEISDFVPFLCTDRDNVTDKVINVSLSDSEAQISVSGNNINICGRDTSALSQAGATFLSKLSDSSVNNGVIDVSIDSTTQLDEHLTVMSLNVRYNLTENAGVSRVDAAVAQIRELSPDVLGIQEDSKQWYTLLDQKLTEYTAVRYMLQAGQDEYLTIYYKTDKFTKVNSGLLWLSDKPDTPYSKFSESSLTRGMNYAILERKSDGARFCFVNTHLEHTENESTRPTQEIARQKQTAVLLEQTAKIVSEYGDIPSIMVGDFNTTVNDTIHLTIRESGYDDCRTDAFSITSHGTWNTGYHDYPNGVASKNSDVLDYCYASEDDFFICSYNVSTDKYNNMYTSDHFPIIIKLLLIK